ncbi:MAG: arsenate reductase (glutaredoxin) [Bacteroidota bacterium]
MKIYHNPRCSKSRQTLQLIQNEGITPEIVLYLKNPVSKKELSDLVKKLDIQPSQLVRKNEAIYKEQFKGKDISETDWLDHLITYPKLMERPIVVQGNRAILGRPPENVLQLF